MKLTLLRIALIPLFVFFYYIHPESWGQWLALIAYALACITDYFDGYLARKLGEVSAFGAFLDPVADKLMVCAVLIIVLQHYPESWLMVCTLIIIGREVWISALREWMSSIGQRDIVAVAKVGKWKTTTQMLALGFLIYRKPFIGLPIWHIGQVLLIIAALLTLSSMIAYTKGAWQQLK
ncbi:CDP-diacylglycerol--glycerol-3-phosphate 3-phosphatidyltransferase [Suttonella ornithocola]|nr:CDP-diacylglycerol--glycerol-3-phosphate 3-phosphatidyltransferase [Suttonella ornithocola]